MSIKNMSDERKTWLAFVSVALHALLVLLDIFNLFEITPPFALGLLITLLATASLLVYLYGKDESLPVKPHN